MYIRVKVEKTRRSAVDGHTYSLRSFYIDNKFLGRARKDRDINCDRYRFYITHHNINISTWEGVCMSMQEEAMCFLQRKHENVYTGN